jgi:DUF2914 family protein/tetratricopeptide repeat protein
MPEPRDPRSIIEAAEQAAAARNYASAVELLREAALLQEATLGPLHLDLANTLNNLGVMCELNDNPVDAEHNFRRAVAIATAALPPDHPFVTTSRENLREFCEARGKPVELPIPSPAVAVTPEPQAPAPLNPLRESRPAESAAVPPLVQRRSVRPSEIGAPIAVVLLLIGILAGHQWLSITERTESPSTIASDPTPPVPTTHQPLSGTPISVPKENTKNIASVGGGRRSRITADSTSVRPTVIKARLCAELEEGLCDPPDRPVPPGPLFFYTQLKSASATTVQHRWYRGDRLYKTEELRIQVGPSGSRAYSRHVLNRESAGSWRVELRAQDGSLLHEERFAVR